MSLWGISRQMGAGGSPLCQGKEITSADVEGSGESGGAVFLLYLSVPTLHLSVSHFSPQDQGLEQAYLSISSATLSLVPSDPGSDFQDSLPCRRWTSLHAVRGSLSLSRLPGPLNKRQPISVLLKGHRLHSPMPPFLGAPEPK